jgi:hypothetical protein
MATASRRAFLTSLGLATGSIAIGVWGVSEWRHHHQKVEASPTGSVVPHVEYAGWLLKPADKVQLTAAGRVHLLGDTTLGGENLRADTAADVDACVTLCVKESECQAFTYATDRHPDPKVRHQCMLKQLGPFTQTPDKSYVSGIR